MIWYSINSAKHSYISDQKWEQLWRVMSEGGADLSCAVFVEAVADGTTTYFFTPAARLLAQALHAVPCAKPRPERLRLVVGQRRAWALNFSRVAGAPFATSYEETVAAPLEQLRR